MKLPFNKIPFNKKPIKKNNNEHLINKEIRAETVVIIDEEKNKTVLPFFVALKKAQEENLDLVQMSHDEIKNVSICKMIDYKKYLYDKKKKHKLIKKNQKIVLVKEIQFRLNTDVHDYETKVNHIKRFLSKGDKVKVIIFFRGREVDKDQEAKKRLLNIVEYFADIAKKDSDIQFGKRTMFLLLSPIKTA